MHARTQIRQAVTALLTENTDAGGNVFESRVYPLDDLKLPAILVYTNNEAVETDTIAHPRTQTRQVSLSVEIYAKANTKADTITDNLTLQVEKLIASDPTIGGLVKDTVLDSTETRLSGDAEKPVSITAMTYQITYRVKENAPDIFI
nr:hypothetical protein 9 [bacterium]